MKKSKLFHNKIILLIVALILVGVTGSSYALWKFSDIQKDTNVFGSKCFEITLIENSDRIYLQKQIPISDEEGMSGTPYVFTIKNICDTHASYQINLEDIIPTDNIKRLNAKYVKVALNRNTPQVLEKFELAQPTIENADHSYQLTRGSLSPKEEETYSLKLWLDEDTPPLPEVMNATFVSRVTVVATYIEEEDKYNNITIEQVSNLQNWNKEKEEIQIKAVSEKYNLIEYSEEGITWKNLNSQKEIILIKEYYQEGMYQIFFKDEMGNIEEAKINTKYLDQTAPIINVDIEKSWNPKLTIQLEDYKSGLSGYQITREEKEPIEWIEITGNNHEATYLVPEDGVYYIWSKDKLDNISYKEILVNRVDEIKPTQSFNVTSSTTGGNGWYKNVNLQVNLIDNESGVASAKYCLTTNDSCIPNLDVSINENSFNYSFGNNSSSQKICVQTIDNSNNVSDVTCSNSYKIDNDLPVARMQVSTNNDSIIINASSSTDNSSGIASYFYSLDGINFIEIVTSNYTFAKLQNNNYIIYLKVKDNAGNISSVITQNALINITRSWTYTSSTGFSVPYSGIYLVQLWGEKGGSGALYNSQWTGGEGTAAGSGSNGSYVYGYTEVSAGTYLYFGVDVGGGITSKGQSDPNPNDGNKWAYSYGGYGGGATDIRINNSDISNRIMVAGGGGGATNSYGAYYRNNEPPGAINMYAGYSVWGGFSINGNETQSNGNLLYGSNGNGYKSGLFGLGPGAGGGGYYGGASGYAVPNQLIGGYRGTSYINTGYFFQYNSSLNSRSAISVVNNGNANMSSPNFQASQTTYQNAVVTITYVY